MDQAGFGDEFLDCVAHQVGGSLPPFTIPIILSSRHHICEDPSQVARDNIKPVYFGLNYILFTEINTIAY